jgi:hypothetical protein
MASGDSQLSTKTQGTKTKQPRRPSKAAARARSASDTSSTKPGPRSPIIRRASGPASNGVDDATALSPTDTAIDNEQAASLDVSYYVDHIRQAIQAGEIAKFTLGRLLPEGIYLNIDSFVPSPIVENRPALVFFTLWNFTPDATSGTVTGEVRPLKSLTPYASAFVYTISDLAPWSTTCGVLSFRAPRSDVGNTMSLDYTTWGPDVAEMPQPTVEAHTDANFDVAARYGVTCNRMTIDNTASHWDDTLYMTFNGQYADLPPTVEKEFLGDHDNGTFDLPFVGLGGPGTPSVDSIPGKSGPAAIAYTAINNGHQVDVAGILDAISDVGAAVATAAFGAAYAPLSAAADYLNHLFNDYVFKDCDAPVVIGYKTFSSQELYDLTYDPNDVKDHYQGWDRQRMQSPCDASNYNVGWIVRRYRSAVDTPTMSPAWMQVAYGQEVGIVARVQSNGLPVSWEWDLIAGSGQVDNFGRYLAPRGRVGCPYGVIRATGLVNGIRRYAGYSVIVLA